MAQPKKIYSVTMEVKVVIRAKTREDAVLMAVETNLIPARLGSIRVTGVFCPEEGK